MTTRVPATPAPRPPLVTERLILRGWQVEDAPAALAVYGHAEMSLAQPGHGSSAI